MFDMPLKEFFIPFLYVLAAFLYCLFLRFVSRWEYFYKLKKKPLTDEACLEKMSKVYGVSEYMIFLEAANQWHVSQKQAKNHFRYYLMSGDIPYYVRDIVRQHKQKMEKSDYPIFPFKNNQPPPCSA